MKLDLQVPHESHLELWNQTNWRYAFLMGGRGNGRSGTASRYTLSQLTSNTYTRGAIMRAVRENIKSSCWTEILDRITEQDAENLEGLSISDNEISFGKNYVRPFGFKASSGSLTARLKSLAGFNYAWIEEMEEIGEDEFRKFDDSLRTKEGRIRIVGTLNPPEKDHWIIKEFFDLEEHPEAKGFYIPHLKEEHKQDTLYIGGTFRENRHNIDEQTAHKYERYKLTNPEYYWQMIEGLIPESVRGKIFKGWELIDELPKDAKLLRIGGDWGWYPDPVATIALYYYDGYYIVDGISYGNEIDDDVVASDIKNVTGGTTVRAAFGADEPKSIELMARKGIKAVKSITGPGSVDTRIKLTADKKIKVVRKNHPIHGNWVWDAYNKYHWAEDKDGNPKGEPDHEGSDPMDAISYAIADLSDKSSGTGVKVQTPNWQGYNKLTPQKTGGGVKVYNNFI